MTILQTTQRSRPHKSGEGFRAGRRLLGGIVTRYRALKRRLADMLVRGDRDHAMLSALTQEIGTMRQRIDADLQRRRTERKRRSAARKTPEASAAAEGKAHEP